MSCDNITICGTGGYEPTDRLLSFNARYVLNGPFGASAEFVDYTCKDGGTCGEICSPMSITIDSTFEVQNCDDVGLSSVLQECYGQSPVWINGLQRTYSRVDNITKIGFSSYFEYLESKPIVTQAFQGLYLSDVFDTIFTYYAGVSPDLVCLESFDDVPILGPIENNNTYQELAALAQAGRAHLFVQVGGCLTVESWKDHNSPVELVIPDDFIIRSEKADYKYPNTTVIRARGASLPQIDCGEKALTNSEGLPATPYKSVYSGVPVPTTTITVDGLSANKEDIKAAYFVADNVNAAGFKENIQDGSFDQKIRKDSLEFFDNTELVFRYAAFGRNASYTSEGIYGYWHNQDGGGGYAGNRDFFNFLPNFLAKRFPVPYSSFGLGAFGSLPFFQGKQQTGESTNNSTNYQQVEVVAQLPISDCGVSSEEISNKYVYGPECLFRLATRRYQEIMMAQNTWNVEVIYMPCIRLNQVVEFKTQDTVDCPAQTIKGIVAGIDLNHTKDDATGGTTMRLSIMDTGCLGETEVVSGNLIRNSCGGSGGQLNPWTTSALGIDQIAQNTGDLLLFATGGAQAFAYYNHGCAVAGDEYTLYFEYESLQNPNTFFFQIANSAIAATLTGSGTYSITFNAPSDDFSMQWSILYPPSDTYIRIMNLTLTKREYI
jgi:hypothetical protein